MGLMDKLGMEEGQVLEHPWLTKAIENAQRRVEGHNFEIRKHLLEYDNVMNKQREVIYSLRREILESRDVKNLILEAIADTVDASVYQHLFAQQEEMKWDVEGLLGYLETTYHYDLRAQQDKLKDMSQQEVTDLIFQDLSKVYEEKEQQMGAESLRHLERMLLLNTIDSKWKDHLYAMDQLKEGIGLRSFAQRDPLIEYKREGFTMFEMMYGSIHQEVAELIFKIQPVTEESRLKGVFSSLPPSFVPDELSGLSSPPPPAAGGPQLAAPGQEAPPSSQPIRKSGPKVGRNEPCPCGSGKKYKKCCGQ